MGTAHNAAMELRACLAEREARVQFTIQTSEGNCDPEDVKLVLALKCQRARNMGYDQDGAWEVRTLPPTTAASGLGERMLPSGMETRTGFRQPWLSGMSRATMHRRA